MAELSIIIAFIAGIVSFLSPCMLPIVPGFLAYLAGSSLADTKPRRLEIFLNAVFFVLGFSVIFAVKTKFKSKYITSFLFGSALAAGWTPCVSAVLGSILGLAAVNPASAFYLLIAYSI